MTELRPEQVADAWNANSEGYDRNVFDFMRPYVDDLVARAELTPEAEVLEVAAGTGALTVVAARTCRRILATDFSEGMLALLRARCERERLGNVEIALMDGQALEVEDASFDVGMSNFGLMLFPDRARGFSELCRALRPGGRALVTGWAAPERFPVFSLFAGTVREVVPDLPQPEGTPPVFSLADRAAFEREMREAGFSRAEVVPLRHVYAAESAESYWSMIKDAAPPTKLLLERLGPETAAKIRDRVLAKLGDRFGDGPVELENEANLGIGIK